MKKAAKRKSPKCITANSLRLVDFDGEERIRIFASSSSNGMCGIQIKNSRGAAIVEIQVEDSGEATIRIANSNGTNARSIGAGPSCNGVTVHTSTGTSAASLGVEHSTTQTGPIEEGYLVLNGPLEQRIFLSTER